jgi:hypothetical protein
VVSSRFVHFADLKAHAHAQGGIKVGQRLIKQEGRWLADNCAADRNALALAAGKRRRATVEIIGEIENGSRLLDPAILFGLVDLGHAQRESDVLAHRHMRIKRIGLEHHGQPRLAGGTWVASCPSMRMAPPVTSSKPAIRRSSVDLPHPEGPTKTTNSPSLISRSSGWMTFTSPKDFSTLCRERCCPCWCSLFNRAKGEAAYELLLAEPAKDEDWRNGHG